MNKSLETKRKNRRMNRLRIVMIVIVLCVLCICEMRDYELDTSAGSVV